MATSERKRQKKRERSTARRKDRRRSLMREKNRGLAERISLAADAPILHCCATEAFWDHGMSSVLISRELPRGQVAYAMILVDRYCLGVKDAMGDVVTRAEYGAARRRMAENSALVPLPPPDLRALVEDAIDFARQIGFEPHPDYQRVKPIFGDIDATAATERFEFGKDGKPYFISGPSDNALRCRQILRSLYQHCGPDGYHYTIPFDGLDPGVRNEYEIIEGDAFE
jgi:hypothetical protein